ncbi:hypothetical protein BGZ94_000331 [Podila epigama]|nr:hypothetical protein BGZ94_000331 [Podila epigama]
MYKSPPAYEIPLILQMICSTLYANDIANCVLVCKTWYELFSPYMWRNIDDQYELDFKEWTSLEGGLERLLANAQHIRKLALFDSRLALILQGSRCTNLTRLRIREQMPRLAANAVMTLIERNPNLDELLLDQPLNAERDEIRLVAAMPKLVRLKKLSVDLLWARTKELLENMPDSLQVLSCGPYVIDYDQEWLEDQDQPHHDDPGDFDDGHHDSDDDGDHDSDDDEEDDSMDSDDIEDDEYDSDGEEYDEEFEELANSVPPEELLQMIGADGDSDSDLDTGSDMDGSDTGSSGSEDSDMYDGELAFNDEKVVEYKDVDDHGPEQDGPGSNRSSGGGNGHGTSGGGSGKGGPSRRDPEDDNRRSNLTGLYLDLVLGSNDMLQFLPMLRRFPNLEHFGVPHASNGNLRVMSSVLRRRCPKIDSLSITQEWQDDAALPQLFQDRHQLRQVKIRPPMSFEIRAPTVIALADHFKTLERIDMFGVGFSSHHIQMLLTTCENLVSFRLSPYCDPKEPEHTFGSVTSPSSSLEFHDMVRQPWVCTKLKFLSIRLSDKCEGNVAPGSANTDTTTTTDSSNSRSTTTTDENNDSKTNSKTNSKAAVTDKERKAIIDKVYKQLGQLRELEMLEIGVYEEKVIDPVMLFQASEEELASVQIRFEMSNSGLDFSLESGLHRMKGLRNLQCLRILYNTESSALGELAEAKWIEQNWPRLQYLDGVSSPSWAGIVDDDLMEGEKEERSGFEYLKIHMPDLVIRERI